MKTFQQFIAEVYARNVIQPLDPYMTMPSEKHKGLDLIRKIRYKPFGKLSKNKTPQNNKTTAKVS